MIFKDLQNNDTKKVNQSSIRYSNQVKEIVDGFLGDSFSEKLENIVIYCFTNIDTIRDEEEKLKEQKKKLQKEIFELRHFKNELVDIQNLSKKLVEKISMQIDEDDLYED